MSRLSIGFASVLITALVGCHGQDPFKGNQNPTRNFNDVTSKANKPYGQVREVDKNPAEVVLDPQDCEQPYDLSVENSEGRKLLTFTEGVASQYRLKIVGKIDPLFSISAGVPKGAQLLRGGREGAVHYYDFTWTPEADPNRTKQFNLVTRLEYQSASTTTLCQRSYSEELNLIVKKTPQEPTLSFPDFPTSVVPFGSEFKFVIEVVGALSAAGAELSITSMDAAVMSRESILDASKAVDCEKSPKAVSPTKWAFECKFFSSKIAHVTSLLNSEKLVDAKFLASLTYENGGAKKTAPAGPSRFKVKFSKNQKPLSTASPGAKP